MGASISGNYENIEPLFTVGYWDIKRAVQKSTRQPVCLWVYNYPRIKACERNTNDRHSYMESVIASIRATMKLRHPNILKIFEFSDDMKNLAFASEPIEYQSAINPQFTKDEAIFASKQLAIAMQFLNEECHIGYLTLCPESVFFTKDFTLKLSLFTFAKAARDMNFPIQMRAPWYANSMHIPANYAAPEVINNQTITIRADTFMYGLMVYYLFTNKHAMDATSKETYSPSQIANHLGDLPEEYQDLVKPCFNDVASMRPNFITINNDEAFSSPVCDCFQYLQAVDSKDPKDVYSFLTGLADIVHVFSTRIKRNFFLPIFIKLAVSDSRYGIIIIPMVMKISESLNKEEFFPLILEPLQPVFGKPNNPVLAKVIINTTDYISQFLTPNQYPDFVFPSIFYALASNSQDLIQIGISKLPLVVENLSSTVLADQILPKLAGILPLCQDASIASLNINVIPCFVTKIDNEIIANTINPKVIELWRKNQWESIPADYYKALVSYQLKSEKQMKLVVPMCVEFLQYPKLKAEIQSLYFNLLLKSTMAVMKDRGVSAEVQIPDAVVNDTHQVQVLDNDPFSTRNKSKQAKPAEPEPQNDPFGAPPPSSKPQSSFNDDPFGGSQSQAPPPQQASSFNNDPFGSSQAPPPAKASSFNDDPFGSSQAAPPPAKPQPSFNNFDDDRSDTDPFAQPKKPITQPSSFENDPFSQPKGMPVPSMSVQAPPAKQSSFDDDPFGSSKPSKPQNNDPFGSSHSVSSSQHQSRQSFDSDPFAQPAPKQQTGKADPWNTQPQRPPNNEDKLPDPQIASQNSFVGDPFANLKPAPRPTGISHQPSFVEDPWGAKEPVRTPRRPRKSFDGDPFVAGSPLPSEHTTFSNDPWSIPTVEPLSNSQSSLASDPWGSSQQIQSPYDNDPYTSSHQMKSPYDESDNNDDPYASYQPPKQQEPPKQQNNFDDDPFSKPKPQQAPPAKPQSSFDDDPFSKSKPQQAPPKPQNSFNDDPFSGSRPAAPPPAKPQNTFNDDPFGGSKPAQPPPAKPQNTFNDDPFSGSRPAAPPAKPQNSFASDPFAGNRPMQAPPAAPPKPANEPPAQQSPEVDDGFSGFEFE